jgi:hypothetical protein
VSFSRSDRPYFSQSEVHQIIQRIASQKSVVIYAGAGVSIDRTGVSWRELVNRLLEDHVPDRATRRAIMETYTPLEAASIACQMYSDMHGAAWMRKVINKLRTLLYSEKTWQRGNLVTTIVELAAVFAERGINVQIVTTNYDSFLEGELQILNLARVGMAKPEIFFESVLVHHGKGPHADPESEKLKYLRPTEVILHLHGYVPEDNSGEAPVILSEVDTIDSQTLTSAILSDLFQHNAVIMVGASLIDPPLLSALARSIRTADEKIRKQRLRVAILPLQGIDFSRVLRGDAQQDKRAIEDYERKAKIRMKQFDVTATFPDFYSQVPQLLREVQVCLDQCLTGPPYENSPARYIARLDRWWQGWYEKRVASLSDCQTADHERLRAELAKIRATLEVEADEIMKIEVWLRWDPKQARKLTLWASSTGTWTDFASMRNAEIQADSKYASVRAFCLGRPEIYATEGESNRWRTHLCVPVRIHNGAGDLLVGVISLASMRQLDADQSTEIAPRNGQKVDAVVALLREAGAGIVAGP